MKIDNKLISKLEGLAKLELSISEKEQIKKDLNNILEMVAKLDELDTSNVAPLTYINEEVNILREDEIKGQLDRSKALENAPDKDDQYFKVPKVIDISGKR